MSDADLKQLDPVALFDRLCRLRRIAELVVDRMVQKQDWVSDYLWGRLLRLSVERARVLREIRDREVIDSERARAIRLQYSPRVSHPTME